MTCRRSEPVGLRPVIAHGFWQGEASSGRAALRDPCSSFVLDGEAVLLGVEGRSNNGLHSRKHDHKVEFYALDILSEATARFFAS